MQHGVNGGNATGNGSLLHSGDSHVQEVVKAAHEELRQLLRQRADIMKRIGTLKQTISGLANLAMSAISGYFGAGAAAVTARVLKPEFQVLAMPAAMPTNLLTW